MKDYNLKALSLSKREVGENDVLFTLYTKELGRVNALAKGAKKITSKLAGHLEPLSLSNVRLVERKNFHIADALLLNNLKNIRKNREAFKEALLLLKFIEENTFELQADETLWRTIIQSLRNLEQAAFLMSRGNLKIKPLVEKIYKDINRVMGY